VVDLAARRRRADQQRRIHPARSDIRAWFAISGRRRGRDVVGTVALIVAVVWLTRRPRPTGVLIGAALVVGGWTSNILDRLGSTMSPPGQRARRCRLHPGRHARP
jgi:hypothetical protein